MLVGSPIVGCKEVETSAGDTAALTHRPYIAKESMFAEPTRGHANIGRGEEPPKDDIA